MKIKNTKCVLTTTIFVCLVFLLDCDEDDCNKYVSHSSIKNKKEMVLIYENQFTQPCSIKDWVIEGPGKVEWQKGKMVLIPDAQAALYNKWEELGRKVLSVKEEYYTTIQQSIEEVSPLMVGKLFNRSGSFSGGHVVCWNNKFETGGDYMVEYDFKPLSPIGLGIIFFSARGCNGEDVLSDKLASRDGVFERYTKGDINCYHISYWANNPTSGIRGSCNLRKNSGFYFLAASIDPTARELDYFSKNFEFKKHKIRLIKTGSKIEFYIDGQLIIDFIDKQVNNIFENETAVSRKIVDTGRVLGGGRIGLRQMAGLKAEYSNFRVYTVNK